MSTLRPLSHTLVDIAEGALAAAGRPGVRATRIEMSLPVDLGIDPRDGQALLLGELPRFVRRTDFDPPPSRLTIVWEEALP